MVIEERPPERVRAGATHPLGNRVHRGRRREQAFSHLHADHPPPTSQGHSCLCAECPLDTACGHMHRGCQLRNTAVVARTSTPGREPPTRTERRPPPTKLPQQPPPETTEGPGHRRSTQDHQQPGPQQPQVKCRRRPTLPHPPRCSTIGAGRLSFRVRKGTGRDPAAKTTDKHYRTNHTHPTNPTGATGVPCRSRHCTMNANT